MELKVNCPFCYQRVGKHDTKKKLSINPAKNVAKCWRCNYTNLNAEKLASQLGLSLVAYTWNTDPLTQRSASVKLPPEYRTDFKSTAIGREAWDYLVKRHVSPVTIAAYDIGYCIVGPYAGRVVIPIYRDGNLINFQARSISGAPPKYMGPAKGVPNSLFNLERTARRGVMLLVEGPFDALRMPEYASSLQGKSFNSDKLSQILSHRPHTIFLALDDDARKEEQHIFEQLAGSVPHVAAVQLNAHDLSDAPEETVARLYRLCRTAERLGAHAPENSESTTARAL